MARALFYLMAVDLTKLEVGVSISSNDINELPGRLYIDMLEIAPGVHIPVLREDGLRLPLRRLLLR